MAVSQYEKDRIARVNARKNKPKNVNKSVYRSPKTDRQKAQDEIDLYKMTKYGKPSTSVAEQPKSTSVSGGSKAVRKVTTPSLVDRLRKNPFKYTK